MFAYGWGYCKNGYYAGWDDIGTANEEDCKKLCLSEVECMYAAYINEGNEKTCSRYNQATCQLLTSDSTQRAYKTFFKGG